MSITINHQVAPSTSSPTPTRPFCNGIFGVLPNFDLLQFNNPFPIFFNPPCGNQDILQKDFWSNQTINPPLLQKVSDQDDNMHRTKWKIPQVLHLKRKRKYKNFEECFKCPIEDCEMLFEKKEMLDDHEKTHRNCKIYTCSTEGCLLMFMNEFNFQKHQKVHLPSGKRFPCPYPGCTKKFTASYNQKIHYRCHTGEKPYTCERCHQAYYDRANYKYHQRTAHKEIRSNDIECRHTECNQKFKTKKQKILHHDKLDEECRFEKNQLVRLLRKFKDSIRELRKIHNICVDSIKGSAEYSSLEAVYESTCHSIMDHDQFVAIFGSKDLI